MAEQPGIGKRLWELLGHISLIHWLWSVPFAFAVTWISRKWKVMPELSGDPIAAVAAAGAVFSGALAGGVSASKAIAWYIPRIKHWRRPHSIRVVGDSGRHNAIVTFTHIGADAIWSVDGKIVRALHPQAKNPDPSPFECIIYKEGKNYRSIGLQDGEWAQITLATIGTAELGNPSSWLAINRGETDISVPNDGVVVELTFKAEPKMKNGPIRKCFKIVRPGMMWIEVTPLSGE